MFSVNSSGLIFAYRALGWFLLHLQAMYIVSSPSNPLDSALTRLCDLVGPSAVTDTLACVLSLPR